MGVDLTVIPAKWPSNPPPPLAYDKLGFKCRPYDVWEHLESASTPYSEGLHWYDDEKGIVLHKENPYGNPVLVITAGKFVEIWDKHTKNQDLNPWDRGIVAFLRELPLHNPVYLWFH